MITADNLIDRSSASLQKAPRSHDFFQATEIIIKLVILDPGCLTFAQPRIEANVDIGTARIEVKRINGKDGKVGCFWNTMEISGN